MPTLQTDQQILTRPDLAALLRCSVNFLAKLAMHREGPPCYKLGGMIRYDKTQVEQWLATRDRTAAA